MASKILIGGVAAPDSPLARSACELVTALHSRTMLHHVQRTWWFADAIGHSRGLVFDRELVYLASLLHDLGLTAECERLQRFEVDGADAARDFLVKRGYPPDKAALVWDAIALHTSAGIADRKQPEVALVHFGAFADVIGLRLNEISPALVAEILDRFPRLGMKQAFVEALAGIVRRKPYTVMGTGLADVGARHVHGFHCPNLCDIIDQAPFDS